MSSDEVDDAVKRKEKVLRLLAGVGESPAPKISQRRMTKKKRKEVESGKGTLQDYYDVYGPNARAELVLRAPDDKSRLLHLHDVSELVNWVLGNGTNLSWCFIKNKPLISKVVLLFLPGLGSALFLRHRELFPHVTSWCRDPRTVAAVSPSTDSPRTARALLTCFMKSKRKLPKTLPSRATLSGFQQQNKRRRLQDVPKPAPLDPESSEEEGEISAEAESRGASPPKGVSGEERENANEGEGAENGSKKEGRNPPFPPSHYVLTAEQMAEREYPQAAVGPDGTSLSCPPGFVMTQPSASGAEALDMVAVDCEMCSTSAGLELTRVTLVSKAGKVLYDKLVLPSNPILNYNTRYSGITAKMLKGVTTTLEDVQSELLQIVSAETILVGHALQNDLRALRLVHCRNLDTAAAFPHPRGPPFRPALRVLAAALLDRAIQGGDKGHDSTEDARAAMDLALLKIRHGPSFGEPKPAEGANLLALLHAQQRRCSLIDRPRMLHRFATGAAAALPCHSDAEVAGKTCQEVRAGKAQFVWARLADVESCQERQAGSDGDLAARSAAMAAELTCGKERAEGSGPILPPLSDALREALQNADERIGQIHAALPPNTMLLLATGHGDTPAVRRLQEMKWKRGQEGAGGADSWGEENERILHGFHALSKTGLLFATVKT